MSDIELTTELEPIEALVTDDRDASAPAVPPVTGPRVRWAGIVWGLVVAGLAASGIWLLWQTERRDGLVTWLTALSPAAAVAYGLLVLGALALVIGAVGVARRIQRAIDRRRSAR